VVAGFVGFFTKQFYTVLLIARRSPLRVGTRFWVHGSDRHGYVANYVEIEQIIIAADASYSYVQVRGSIPLSWSQYLDLTHLPNPKHFDRLHGEYRHSVVISLMDNRSREKAITNVFNALGPTLRDVQYHSVQCHEGANL
jgi:hypothetical protein